MSKNLVNTSFKWAAIAIGGLVLVIILALLAIQTSWFKDWLRDEILVAANEILIPELEIQNLDGTFIGSLSLNEVRLSDLNETLIHLPEFAVEYDLLALLGGEIHIEHVLLDSLFLNLEQREDSTWNLEHIVPPDTTTPDTTEASAPLGWELSLDEFYLKDAEIDIALLSPAPGTPEGLDDLNIRLGAQYADSVQQLKLDEFRFELAGTTLKLEQIAFLLQRDHQEIALTDFIIKTAGNAIAASAQGNTAAPNGAVEVDVSPVNFDEFRFALPDLVINATPEINLGANLQGDELDLSVRIHEKSQAIALSATFDEINTFIDSTATGIPKYDIELVLQHFNPEVWLSDSSLAGDINATLTLNGQGLDVARTKALCRLELDPSYVAGYDINRLEFVNEIDGGNLQSDLNLLMPFVKLSAQTAIQDLMHAQLYDAQIVVEDLDLAPLLQDDSLHSDIDLQLYAQGEGFDTDSMNANVQLEAFDNRVADFSIDSLFASARLLGSTIWIDTFTVSSVPIRVNAHGKTGMDGASALKIHGNLGNLGTLSSIAGVDTLAAVGHFEASIDGPLDSLSIQAGANLSKLIYDEIYIDSVSVSADLLQTSEGLAGHTMAQIVNNNTADIPLTEFNVRTELANDHAYVDLQYEFDPYIKSAIKLNTNLASVPTVIGIDQLTLTTGTQEWYGGGPTTQISIDDAGVRIQDFQLNSVQEDGADQFILADGVYRYSGDEDLRIAIANLQLEPLIKLVDETLEIQGTLGAEFSFTGTAEAPELNGDLRIKEIYAYEHPIVEFRTGIKYVDSRMDWSMLLKASELDSLTGSGFVPINLSSTHEGEPFDPDAPLAANLVSDGLSLELLKASGEAFSDTKGKLTLNLNVAGTANNPELGGELNILDGAFNYEAIGAYYENIQAQFLLEENVFQIAKFELHRDEGHLKASGAVTFDSSLISGNINTTEFAMTADDFWLARNRDYEINIGADIAAGGSLDALEFNGTLSIFRSRFYLPAFIEAAATAPVDPGTPLLVAATTAPDTATGQAAFASTQVDSASSPDFLTNMRGSIKVSIPRNTWLRSPELNMEISGDLDVVKNGPDFELFGPLQIMRGYYELFGRRFTVIEGLMTFQGGTEYNPEITLETEYIFRAADKSKRYLKLLVTGKALNPDIAFILDDEDIEEGDAIAYILFGRSMDELSRGEQSSMGDDSGPGTEEMAKQAVAGLLAGQLATSLGHQLNLDIIEIKGSDNWESASFIVGKYLTNDLFMQYERSFGDLSSSELPPEIVTLEYEVVKHLYLQLIQGQVPESGFDIITRFKW